MRDGRIVFNGNAGDLTTDVARDIYGAGKDFDEATTSTELERPINGYRPVAASGTAAPPSQAAAAPN